MATRQPMRRPVPGPASVQRDYTQPPPGGTHYPWEPGGGSKVPGVPDNWSQFYPSEQEGRGDAWMAVKKAQLNKEHPPSSYQNMPSARDSMSPQDFAQYQHNALPQNQAAKDALAGMHDPSHDVPQGRGDPNKYNWQTGGWNVGYDPTIQALRMHGVKPGPLTNIGQGKGSGGYYTGDQILKPGQTPSPTGTTAAAKKKTPTGPATPGANQQTTGAPDQASLGPQFAAMKPGTSVNIGGKTYFKNKAGAVVDYSDPKNRQRVTDVQGNFFNAPAAAPTAAPQQTQAPTTQQGAPPADWQSQMQQQFQQMQDQLNQQFQQYNQRPSFYPGASPMDPYGGGVMNQLQQMYQPMQSMFGGGYGGGGFDPGYGWNPGYGGGGFGGGGMAQPNTMYAGGNPNFDEGGGIMSQITAGPGMSGPMMRKDLSGQRPANYGNYVDMGQGMGYYEGATDMNNPYGMMTNGMAQPNMNFEASQMNPYNPNMQMYY